MTIEWHADKVLNAARIVLDGVSKEVAKNVMEDAKKILRQKAKTTTAKGLLSQFSMFKGKGDRYVVGCQMEGNWHGKYHSSFVELGTPGEFKRVQNPNFDPMRKRRNGNFRTMVIRRTERTAAKPFLRPANQKNKSKANKMYQQELDKL